MALPGLTSFMFINFSNSLARVSLLWLLCIASFVGAGLGPSSPPLVFFAERGEELLIRLGGFDTSGRSLSTTILSLPVSDSLGTAASVSVKGETSALAGAIFELSQLFVSQGLQPRRGRPVQSAPLVVDALAGNRLLYVAPQFAPPLGAWGKFSYRVSDGPRMSLPGFVWILPPHGHIVHSDFRNDADGWKVIGKATLTREGFSRGLLSQYLVATDTAIQAASRVVDSTGKKRAVKSGDSSLWKFLAPQHFLGNKVVAYGGSLGFTAGAFAGDFSLEQVQKNVPLVSIECSSCRGGQGVRIGFFADAKNIILDGKTKKFNLPLTPDKWVKDPRNTLQPWTAIAECELVQVLSAVSELTILGDWTAWFETVAIDDVYFSVSQPYMGIPRSCYT